MSNIEIDAPLVNGDLMPYHGKGESCRLAVETLIGNDFGAPPRSLNFMVHTKSGKTVNLIIPYDNAGKAKVFVDGDVV